eukprot:Rhum_TRINITY_DN15077_c0_g1::Rhum_TRINITY_DN15077_c0_g1_i10::g.135814::m.135814
MDPRIIKAIIIFVCLVVVALQTAALADPAGYVKCKTDTGNGCRVLRSSHVLRRTTESWVLECGIFECRTDGDYRSIANGDVSRRIILLLGVATFFGVTAAVPIGISLILHVLQLFPKIVDKLVCVMKRYWIVHIFTAICCAICWSLLLAYYFENNLNEWYNLQHGFYFQIINMCLELALAFVCFKRRHSDSPKSIEEESVPPQHPDHQSASPIEGECQ